MSQGFKFGGSSSCDIPVAAAAPASGVSFAFKKPETVAPSPVLGSSFTPASVSTSSSVSSAVSSSAHTPETVTAPQFSLGRTRQLNTRSPRSHSRQEIDRAFAMPENEWRKMEWGEEAKEKLLESIRSFKPASESVSEARILLIGPVGAGKSSFISSVQSVFSGRVINRAMVGSSSSTSFTKKLRSFNITGSGEKADEATALVLCDVMGVGEGESTGLTLHDALSVIKGHTPEGHQFSPDQPVGSDTEGFIRSPRTKDKVHCVVFVVDGSKVGSYAKSFGATFQHLREHISSLGVHQVALVTHADQVCKATGSDISQVYRSLTLQQTMEKAGALLGMATSYIVPVKNYSSELDVDENTDVLLLRAVDHILQYANLYFLDNSD